MSCRIEGCPELPLVMSEFCAGHLPDKEIYKSKLLEAASSGLDLAGSNLKKADLRNAHLVKIDLSKANLSLADLSGAHIFDCGMEGSDFVGANMNGCDLNHCNLHGADLTKASLTYARLWNSNLENSNLTESDLSYADLWGANLFDVKLWRVVLSGTKSITKISFAKAGGSFNKIGINESGLLSAEESYRNLKQYFISNGMYNDASWASYKEKSIERLAMRRKGDLNYLPSMLMNVLCGYGEKPYRIVLSSLLSILVFAFIYSLFNTVESSIAQGYLMKWSDYLYYSTITFTTVGYGDIVPKPNAAFRLLAAAEAFIGVFLTGLFIFTLARKYSAR